MMANAINPSFSPHPGMQQHPGMAPGHPMAQAMAHNASQPGMQQGGMPQHLHMGVSGPGGPQMNPNVMMAGQMPPGGPNAHAMQHLNPQQAQAMFAQQQQQMGGHQMFNASMNPQLAQLQQQRMQQIQQQQRQLMMSQQNLYGGGGGMPMAGPMNAAQMAAMRQRAMHGGPHGVPTPHAQALMAQQLAIQQQQQQQAANSQMAHGQNPGQPGQMNPQQMHAAAQSQQLAAALAASQAHQQAQAPQQQPPASAPQQVPTQSQPQMPTPQQSQAGPPPNVSQPAQPPTQAPAPQQPNQQAQQAQQPPNTQSQPQPNAMAVQAAHQQQAMAASLMQQQQQKREGMKGHCLLKLMQFGEHLSGFPGSKGSEDISYWTDFVNRFFSRSGTFRHTLHDKSHEDGGDRSYDIPSAILARYFHAHFNNGVINMQLVMDKGTIDKPMPGDRHFVENQKSSIVYWYESRSHLVATGTIRCHFDAEQKIELFEFLCNGYEEYISRDMAIEAARPNHNWVKDWHKVNSQDNKQSPEMSKKGKARPMKSPQNPPPDFSLPHTLVNKAGITDGVNDFLELSETMVQMMPLYEIASNQGGLGPYAALDQFNSELNTNGPNVNGQAMPQGGPRTPGFGQFPMHASPHAPHLQLPGSPHVGSPAAGGVMQAPGMHPSQSQQGTSSGGPSADTSPAGTKRRRPSGVKVEDEMGTPASAPTPNAGPQVNGIQNKTKPPTPRMQKKQKVNPT